MHTSNTNIAKLHNGQNQEIASNHLCKMDINKNLLRYKYLVIVDLLLPLKPLDFLHFSRSKKMLTEAQSMLLLMLQLQAVRNFAPLYIFKSNTIRDIGGQEKKLNAIKYNLH